MVDKNLIDENGTWKYTNKLINATSPYLLAQAHQPVNWYPWGKEAIRKAQSEDKPIFISIGYSGCTACNMMEQQAFSNMEIGELLNQNFICIKIDKEERPDLDEIYMIARQILTGNLGWPNHLFLTNELHPFFAFGTIEVESKDGKTGFRELIKKISHWWLSNKADIINKSAKFLLKYVNIYINPPESIVANNLNLNHEIINKLTDEIMLYYDLKHGGFLGIPKFPREAAILFLLKSNNEHVRQIGVVTVEQMLAGGIYDHLQGGFHRYTVDEAWLFPNFEKTLYNQALMVRCVLEAYSLTKLSYYKYIIDSSLKFVTLNMRNEQGGFYSSINSKTDEGKEGYYLWKLEEIHKTLTLPQMKKFFSVFALAKPKTENPFTSTEGVIYCYNIEKYHTEYHKFGTVLGILLKHRLKKTPPKVNTKVLTAWHAMMMGSFALIGSEFSHQPYIDIAVAAAEFLEKECIDEKMGLLRIAGHNNLVKGFLEDYAYSIAGLIAVYEATKVKKWLQLAITLQENADGLFKDPNAGGYHTVREEQEAVDFILPVKDARDKEIPSGNAIMLSNLLQFACLSGDKRWLHDAENLLAVFSKQVSAQPMGYISIIQGLRDKLQAEQEFLLIDIPAIDYPTTVYFEQEFTIKLEIDIKKGYYIHSNHETNKLASSINILGSENLILKGIKYPKGTLCNECNIWQNKFIIQAKLLIKPDNIACFEEKIHISLNCHLFHNQVCIEAREITRQISITLRNTSANDNKLLLE
jgi:hypothetical protein